MKRLIKGTNLNSKQREQVLSAFVHRNTLEKPCKAVGVTPKQTDKQWLDEHAFYFIKDGSRLNSRIKHCEPHYLADETGGTK